MKILRWFRKNGIIYQEIEWDQPLKNGNPDRLSCSWLPEFDGPLPDNIIIEDEENTIQEQTETSKKNTYEETKRIQKESGGPTRGI